MELKGGASIPTRHGTFRIWLPEFHDTAAPPPVVLTLGVISSQSPVLLRVHSECFTGDVIGSQRCDCGEQLARSMDLISQRNSGLIIYLRQEGRGIGLAAKIDAYLLQDTGLDTYDANVALGHPPDNRSYVDAIRICGGLAISAVDLITNNPDKVAAFRNSPIRVNSQITLPPTLTLHNRRYLETKRLRFGHDIPSHDNETEHA